MAIGVLVPILLWAPKTHFVKGLLIGGLIIVVFGVIDDIKDLKPKYKLIGQIAASLVIILVSGVRIYDLGCLVSKGIILPNWVAIPLTIFVIVGVTNATNLSDGLDGLAGGIALLIFLCIGYLAVDEKAWVITMIAIAMGGSVLGFLRFNSYPAQLFMGDAGSQLLGFVSVVLLIQLTQQSENISSILPMIILGIPVLDTIAVMIKRLINGKPPFSADKNHFHHQLIKIGFFHTEAVLIIYLCQSSLILFAIKYNDVNDLILIFVYIIFSISVLLILEKVNKTGYQIHRNGMILRIKSRLKPLKDRGQLIKVVFGFVKFGLPLLMFYNALIPVINDKRFILLSCGFFLIIGFSYFINKEPINKIAKIAIYLFTPFMVFKSEKIVNISVDHTYLLLVNILYLLLLAAVLLTMKFTRRSNGFRSSTLDFLVIFVIILVPNLPNTALQGYLLGLVALKIVVLYYSYEVLMGELRRKPRELQG